MEASAGSAAPGRHAQGEPPSPDEGGGAPAVVALVVTHDPGPWFEECLISLAAQDYPSLDLLVVDAGSSEPVAARVAAIVPGAYVRRLETNPGYGAAANDVLDVVEGAAFHLLCHDDVALAPDTVRALVEEAFRSNGGIIGPKLVRWEDPSRLLAVGLSVDKTGVPEGLADRDELDQEQFDAVRDVFAVPGSCVLVRADLFETLGGFDPEIDFLGDDVDLCWRAHVVGARVLVAPAAVARHVEALGERRPDDDRRRLYARHRLRSMLTCYSFWHLVRVLPQAVLFAGLEFVYTLLSGHWRQAGDVVSAWTWNARRLGQIATNRRRLQRLRTVRDSEIRRLQVRGSARFSAFLRGQIGQGDDRMRSLTAAGRELAGSFRQSNGIPLVVWAIVAVFLIVGSRDLVTSGIAAVGDIPKFANGPGALWDEFTSGWRDAGLGSESPAPTAFALLGFGGLLTFGAMGLLRTILVVGLLPAGAIGAWRLLRWTGAPAVRLVALGVFLAIPVPYNAIATGRWGGLVVWAASPWIIGRLALASRDAPFGRARETGPDGPPAPRSARADVLGLGLLLAVVTAFVPFAVALVPLVGLALAAGALSTGNRRGAARTVGAAVGAAVVAAVLHIPWTFDFLLPGSEWSAFGGPKQVAGRLDLDALFRFETGPIGAAPLGWAFLVAAVLPLAIGRSWRFTWAVRGWYLAIGGWGLAWVADRDWFPLGAPAPEVLLAPAAVGLAMAVALGLAAFQFDVPHFRFGWRQVAAAVAALAAAVGAVPVLGAVFDGRWDSPTADYADLLGFLDLEGTDVGPFRVLWVGDPSVVPLAGWELDDGLVYATSDNGVPTVENRWAGSSEGPTQLISDALSFTRERQTSRLGRLLAPMGIRYIVVPQTSTPFGDDVRPPPGRVLDGLAAQLDLERVDVDASVVVYRNAAWFPVRAELPQGEIGASGLTFFAEAESLDEAGAPVALADDTGYTEAEGTVTAGSDVYLAASSADGWEVDVDGEKAVRRKAFGWANAFAIDDGGEATLRYSTSPLRAGMLLLQAALWVAVIRLRRAARRIDVPA